ncbi:MAG: SprT-like domain-containing protein [Candidatus Thiodiazotropha sp.]
MKPEKRRSCAGDETDATYQDLEAQTLQHTRRLINQASERFDLPIPQPEVRFDLRGRAAGMALSPSRGRGIIRYNRAMLAENGLAFIRQTVPHEVAHLVAGIVHGRQIKPHGAEWRSIMALFGADAVRCHSFPVPSHQRRNMRYFFYRCACRNHRLSATRHNRSQAGVVYLCRSCGSPLSRSMADDSLASDP